MRAVSDRAWGVGVAFAALTIAYQLPEGVGQRLLGSFPAVVGFYALFAVIAWVVARSVGRNPADAYALRLSRTVVPLTVVLFVASLAVKLASVRVGVMLDIYTLDPAGVTAGARALAMGLPMTLVPSIAEDIVTRGFWFRASGIRWSAAGFILASSVIYVANHIFRLRLGPGEWTMLFVFGLTYAAAVFLTGSLWPAVGLHWGWNYGNAVVDALLPVTAPSITETRVLAIASHVLLLGLTVIFVAVRRRRQVT